MSKFSVNQIKCLSSTFILLLSYQSLAFANPSINKKLNLKKIPHSIAQSFPANQDVLVPNPRILIDGKPVEMSPQQAPPPFLPRAVAPPVGDMSVSTSPIVSDRIQFLLSDPVIPRLSLRQAPIDEVLRVLGELAQVNVIYDYNIESNASSTSNAPNGDNAQPVIPKVTLDITNEKVSSIFNNLLALYRLEAVASPDNPRLILISKSLPYSVNNTISRTFRLNQAKAVSLAGQLALLGATSQQIVETIERTVLEGREDTAGGAASNVRSALESQVATTRKFVIEPLTANSGSNINSGTPLPLRRLNVTADERTNTITLTGTPRQIQIASDFIVQSDIRLRQVAVNVKIVDVQLDQQDSFGASFSFGIDNTGVVQDGGIGVINFGTNNRNVDPNSWRQVDGQLVPAYNEQISITEGFSNNLANDLTSNLANSLNQSSNSNLTDNLNRNFTDTINRTLSQFGNTSNFSRDQVENLSRALTENLTNSVANTLNQSDSNALTRNITDSVARTVSRTLQGLPLASPNSGQISPFGTNADPNNPRNSANIRPGSNFNVPQAFLAQIRANISSGNAKILTDPTLVVQEGQIGSIALVENVVTSVNTQIDQLSGVRTTTPVLEEAGLTLGVSIEKIDDNGFISLKVNPTVSAPGNAQIFRSGVGADNVITPLVVRTVDSGLIRLRDGQTLILSGIIQDGERTQVSKVPILGDLPLIGSLFRSTFKDKTRSEVIVMLTPQILDDSEGYSGFGYNYTPSRETGKYLRDRGLNVPSTPY